MKIEKIYECINELSPFCLAEEWDNSGILINVKKDIKRVLLALDCSVEVANKALKEGYQLIITHHPLIFTPINEIDENSILFSLIKNSIGLISTHTPFDKSVLGVALAEKIGLKNVEGDGFITVGETDKKTVSELAEDIKERLSLSGVRYSDCTLLHRVAVVPGSGGSFLEEAKKMGADTLITGDIKHDVFLKAKEIGISLIDASHFATEIGFSKILADYLRENTDLEVTVAEETPPYKVI